MENIKPGPSFRSATKKLPLPCTRRDMKSPKPTKRTEYPRSEPRYRATEELGGGGHGPRDSSRILYITHDARPEDRAQRGDCQFVGKGAALGKQGTEVSQAAVAALVHGPGFGYLMRTKGPLPEVPTNEVPEAQPVQAPEVSLSVTELV